MTKMFQANAVARTEGRATFASAVFDGPVLRKAKKIEMNMNNQASGKGMKSAATKNGNARSMPVPETRKYEPGKRVRKWSASQPPRSVEPSPATTVIRPK